MKKKILKPIANKINKIIFAPNKNNLIMFTRLKRKDRRNKTSSHLRVQRIKLNTQLVKVKSPNTERTVIIEG